MAYLIFILVTIGLFVGFFMLTWYEAARGVRVFAPQRARLDNHVKRAEFIVEHVDLKAFVREELRRIVTQAGHALSHLTLRAVRAVERLLTRLVRYLRTEHEVEVRAPGETREFVKTLSDFKGRLKDTMPEVPSVHDQD
ncbi:MAG: hypothetical protein WC030_02480 [Candidatus Paceibacterota bacterium]